MRETRRSSSAPSERAAAPLLVGVNAGWCGAPAAQRPGEACPETGGIDFCGCSLAARTGAASGTACVIDTAGHKAVLAARVAVVLLGGRTGKYDEGIHVPGAMELAGEHFMSQPGYHVRVRVTSSADHLDPVTGESLGGKQRAWVQPVVP